MSNLKYQEHFYESLYKFFSQLSIDVKDKDEHKFVETLHSMSHFVTHYINSAHSRDDVLKQRLVILNSKIYADLRNKVKHDRLIEDLSININIIRNHRKSISKSGKGFFGRLFSRSSSKKPEHITK